MRSGTRRALAVILVAAVLAAPAGAVGPEGAAAPEEAASPEASPPPPEFESVVQPRASRETPFDNSGPHLPPILDFFLLRPPAVVATAGGLAVWLVCLPFNTLAGKDAVVGSARTLIVAPGRYAFVDRLGSH